MNTTIRLTGLAGLLAIAALGSGLAQAGQVYKWVDDKGVTHYGEKPPATGNSQALRIEDTTSSDAEDEIKALDKKRQDAADANKKQKDEAEGQKKIPSGANANADDIRKLCEQHRKNLQMMNAGGRVSVKDDKGNRRYLSDDEVASMRASAQTEVDHCDALEKQAAQPAKK